jgi:SRSO17 transposase
MAQELDAAATTRLDQYLARLGTYLKDCRKRESFAIYAFGLLGESERKSVEPIAALAAADPEETHRMHNKLLHFVGKAAWSDEAVRREATAYVCEALQKHEDITTWVIDDTGFLKQGTHSVGVQRQYTGTAGKITNCQIGVSLAIATPTAHAPIDFELYLPKSWTEDEERREAARIPEEVEFKTKTDLALQMMERACRAGIPGEILLADSGYGDSSEFRETTRLLGLDYAVGISKTTKVCRIGTSGRLGTPMAVADIARRVPRRQRRRMTWRDGTKSALQGRFHFCRVKPCHDNGQPIAQREPVWLVVEWSLEDKEPSKFYLSTLPRRMSQRSIVRTIKERWRTERMYQDLKGELGLDHFEGRSFPGWHHHLSVAICCYAFVLAERLRAFPPSSRRAGPDDPLEVAA